MLSRLPHKRNGSPKPKSWSIKAKLTVLFIIGGLLPMLFFSYYIYYYSHQLIVKKESAAIQTSIQAAADSISNILSGMENGILEVLSFPVVQQALQSDDQPPSVEWFYLTKQVEEMLTAITSSNQLPYSITLIGANGNVYSNGLFTNFYEKIDGGLAQKVVGYHWRNVVLKRVGNDGSDVITMGKAVKRSGELAGVILFDIPMDRVHQYFSADDFSHMNIFGLY